MIADKRLKMGCLCTEEDSSLIHRPKGNQEYQPPGPVNKPESEPYFFNDGRTIILWKLKRNMQVDVTLTEQSSKRIWKPSSATSSKRMCGSVIILYAGPKRSSRSVASMRTQPSSG